MKTKPRFISPTKYAKYLVQYLYFLRYPILLVIAINVFTRLASGPLRYMTGNLFELRYSDQLRIVVMLVVLAGFVITFTSFLIMRALPRISKDFPPANLRQEIYNRLGNTKEKPRIKTKNGKYPLLVHVLYFIIVSGFILIVGLAIMGTTITHIVEVSSIGPIGAPARKIAISGIGIAVGSAFWCWLTAFAINRFSKHPAFPKWLIKLGDLMPSFYGEEKTWQLTTIILALSTFLVYTYIGLTKQLLSTSDLQQLPALGYLLLLLIVIGWILPALSLALDQLRIPTPLVLVVISFVCWLAFESDHFYEALPANANQPSSNNTDFTPEEAFQTWLTNKPISEYPVITLVTANGGGIRAAVWTTQVFKELQSELGKHFTQSIALISSVSGGSVGTMYFVDAFDNGPPTEDALEQAVRAANTRSLPQIARAIAYADIPRLFLGGLIPNDKDRGWALEKTWAQQLGSSYKEGQREIELITLGTWKQGVIEGWRPLVIFNSTIVETGERMLLTNVDSPRSDCLQSGQNYLYFNDCYPGYDLRIETAARLSASFPYVSPVSRPIDSSGQPITPGYHLGDGGYYDNNGVLSAIEWLRSVQEVLLSTDGADQNLASVPAGDQRKVLIIHIRSSPPLSRVPPNESAGWFYSFAGPVLTLINAWNSTQFDRDEILLDQFEQAVPGIEVEQVFFTYCGVASLSWQLSEYEANTIVEQGIDSCKDGRNRQALETVRTLFSQKEP